MKVVFLDRDGVINRKIENGYVLDWEDFEFLPQVAEAIRLLNERKIPVFLISNQSAVNRGHLTMMGLKQINHRMQQELNAKGAHIDDIFICPHRPDENCNCRKPKTGLFEQASAKYPIDLSGSWFIGDSDTDIRAGRKIGCKTYQIKEGNNLREIILEILEDWQ